MISSDTFIQIIQEIYTNHPKPKESNHGLLFRFEVTKEAALHNAIV
jgi:hypothetical protein